MNAKKSKPTKDGKKSGGDKTAETKATAQSADAADSSASAKAAKADKEKAKGGGKESESEKSGGDEKDSAPAGGENGGEDSSPLDPLEAYSAEELREMVRLAAADKENILRRAENEIRKARDFALQTFASGICEVRDGLEAATADKEKSGGASEGVLLTLRKLCAVMEKNGIRPVSPDIGATFDSSLHYAVGMSEGGEGGQTIAEVKQCGYTLNGRLVRPAIVWLGKPPAKDKDSESKTAPGKSGGE